MFEIRQATLDDTGSICKLARSRIGVWQRIGQDGRVEDVGYEGLSIYERWLHGGPWMNVETGALQLSHLLCGAGIPIVVELHGQVIAFAEVYAGTEPEPFGRHLHVATIIVYTEYTGGQADDTLIDWIIDYARKNRYARVTSNCAASDEQTAMFFIKHGFKPIDTLQRMILPVRSGQVFYKAVEHLDSSPKQIENWFLNIGRSGSARSQWETRWQPIWNAIPEIKNRRTHRLSFNAAGNEAFVLVQQQLYQYRNADVFCWTPKPPSGQLLTAIRDWGQREGYRKLVMLTISSSIKTLGLDAEPDGYTEHIYAIDLK